MNGILDGEATNTDSPLDIKSPAKMFIGGWGNFVFNGDMDEVRVSKVARSAAWVKLQYDKPETPANRGRSAGAAGRRLRGLGEND